MRNPPVPKRPTLAERLGIKLQPREVREANAGEQQVSRGMRRVCACAAAGLLGITLWEALQGASVGELSGFIGFGAFFVYLAVFGLRRDPPFPPATARFRELAHPARWNRPLGAEAGEKASVPTTPAPE